MLSALICLCLTAEPAPHPGKALLEGKPYIASHWTVAAYETLWKQWGLSERPADFAAQVQRRYGLGPAPYPNDGLPMGLRRTAAPHRDRVALDCMVCHGGTLFGKGVVGLPNTSIDLAALFADLQRASGLPLPPQKLDANRTRGVNNAGGLGVLFFSLRNEDLAPTFFAKDLGWERFPDLDTPAWWLLHRKRWQYCDAGTSAASSRAMMQFMLTPGRPAKEVIAADADFQAIRGHLLEMRPPKYPFAVDAALARRGAAAFARHCAECHGSYGERPSYPGRMVPLDEIGTDPVRHRAITDEARRHYNATWYGAEHPARKTAGYQAPPLDGVWATAPYFHNGSVPTLAGVLDPARRPRAFRLADGRDEADFDPRHVGWQHEAAAEVPASAATPAARRAWYDTRRFGAGNGGHGYGAPLAPAERAALIEYLKTL